MCVDGSEARVATMSEYDVQMASTGSANEAPGDYSKRMRDKKIMLAQYPGPDAKRFYSWTNGPLAKHLANKDAPDKMPDVVMDLAQLCVGPQARRSGQAKIRRT